MRINGLGISLLLLAGCQDVMGLGGSCAGEMQSVRRAEGTPDHNTRTQQGGDFTETWVYLDGEGRVYTFRWGTSFDSCQLIGPAPLDLIPPVDELRAAWVLLES
jgi:hypothetical protein